MLRKSLLASAVILPMGIFGSTPAALADTDVDVHFGIPFYSYQVDPDYRYYADYGWYDADRYTIVYDDDGYYDGEDVYYDDDNDTYIVVHDR